MEAQYVTPAQKLLQFSDVSLSPPTPKDGIPADHLIVLGLIATVHSINKSAANLFGFTLEDLPAP